MIIKARPHHYRFAHKMLPLLFFKDAEGFVSKLKSGCGKILSGLWGVTASTLDEKDRIPLCDFKFRRTIKSYKYAQILFVEMPEAKCMAEALIVAFVLLKVPEKDNRLYAYYLTVDFMGADSGVTCPVGGWTDNGSHVNYMCCTPDIQGFSKKIREICEARTCRILGKKFRFPRVRNVKEL